MTLAPPTQGNRARYDITVVSPENNPSGKESKRFSRKGYSRVKNIGTKMGAALVALMIAGLMLMGNISAAPTAKAGDWGMMNGLRDVICGTAYFNAEPDDRGLGPNTADPTLLDPSKAKLTGYEKYGMAGMTWTVWLGPEDHGQLTGDGDVAGKNLVSMGGGKDSLNNWAKTDGAPYSSFYNTKGECSPIGDVGPTAVGNFLLSVTSWIVHISNLLFQTATETSSSVLLTLSPTVVTIVTKLKDALYLEFLAPALMVGALFLAWKGLVKRSSTEAGTAALWMLGATVAGFAILANPMFLPSVVNTVVSKVSETTIATITQVAQSDSSTSGASASGSNLCSVGDYNGKTRTSDNTGKLTEKAFDPSQNAARTSVRQIQCTMWYSFMYTPWVIGQFGVSPSATDKNVLTSGYPSKTGDIAPLVGIPQNIALGAGNTPGNWAVYQLDNKVNYPGSDKTAQEKAMLNVAASQLYKADPNGTWKGTSAMNRVTTSTLALISALGSGAMIAIISMSMIVLQIGLVILTLFAPLFLLVGVHPGFGRRVAMGWLESMAGLAMKRIVLSVLLSVMLVFYSAVLSASASIDWLISMIMVIAVSVGGISYKDQLTTMFSRINFGGNGGLSEADMGGQQAKRAAGSAIRGAAGLAGAATALGVGAVIGGAGARKNNKELQQKAREEIAARRAAGGDDPSAGAGDRPNGGPNDDGSPSDPSGAGDRPNGGPDVDELSGAGERPANNGEIDGQEELFPESDTPRLFGPAEDPSSLATGRHTESAREEIDGQEGLFPEADVRPKQNFEADPRMAGDIAAGQASVNQERRKLYGQRPATEEDGRRAAIDKAQQDALRENARYNRFHKINAGKEKFTNKIDATKGTVQRTVGMVGDTKRNAANAVTRSVANSAPARAATAAAAATKARADRAREAANSYHTLAKSNSQTYNKAVERHNENKVVKQVRRDENKIAQQKRQEENKEIKRIVATHEKRASVTGEAMRQARARAQSKKNNDLQKMIARSTRRM